MLKDKINDNMSTYLSAQENSIEKFVTDSEQKLVLFSKNKIVTDLIEEDLKDFKSKGYYLFKKDGTERPLPMFNAEGENTSAYFEKNYTTFADAQAYVLDYYSHLNNWEGLYIGNQETRALAYSVPPVIGKVFRADPVKRQELMDGGRSKSFGFILVLKIGGTFTRQNLSESGLARSSLPNTPIIRRARSRMVTSTPYFVLSTGYVFECFFEHFHT